jgi:hypothetical protein
MEIIVAFFLIIPFSFASCWCCKYAQYKDRTPLKLYAYKNHNTRKRMQNYYRRHSGTSTREKGLFKEKKRSDGIYNAKILSHKFLW